MNPISKQFFVDRTGNRSVFKTEKRNQSVKDVGMFHSKMSYGNSNS